MKVTSPVSSRTPGPGLALVAALGAIVATLGCSSAIPAPLARNVAIDPSFTSDQADAISGALADWNKWVPGSFTWMISACPTPSAASVCMQPVHAAPDPSDDVVGATVPGTDGSASVLLYVDRIGAAGMDLHLLTEQTAGHELGHVLGLQHSLPGQLMAAQVPDQAHTVTQADVDQFWAIRNR